MARFDIAEIRRYYDRHARSFIRFGQGGSAGARTADLTVFRRLG